jgi:hypothetical protein
MAARLFAELFIGLLIVVAILVATYRFTQARQGDSAPELDVSRTPSEWFTDSRTAEGGRTEVCVVRVETRTGLVLERRVLRVLDNQSPDYKDQLDKAMDDAYETMRILNVNLRRR